MQDERWYRQIFDGVALGVLVFDVEGRILDANQAAHALLGYDDGELRDKSILDIAFLEDMERELPLLSELVEGRRPSYRVEKRFRRKDGGIVFGRATCSRVAGDDGETQCVLRVVEDIAPERAAAEERRELEEQLRQAQKMEALGRLAGGIAHDFNNLLHVVLGHAQLALVDELEPVQSHVREIEHAARRAAALTEQLLTYSRAQPVAVASIDLNDVVSGVQTMLRRLLEERIDVVTRLSGEPCVITCDRSQIEQVLVNLAVNARDAMPNGGTLTIETSREERDDGPVSILAVSDTGEGMDAPTLERACDPFFTTKEVGKGTGLGLSTVDGIVARCGGTVRIESTPGSGTRVELVFPAAYGRPQPPSPGRAPVHGARGHEKVLLVEDDEAVRQLVGKYLTLQGYRVLSASSGVEALEVYADADFDLLVTDAVMARVSGHELAQRLRERKPDLPVVYMSGYDPEAVGVADGDERSVFLRKPYGLAKLAGVVRSLLQPA